VRGRNQTVPAPRAADGSANRGCRPELDELRRRRTARPRTGGLVRGVEQARPTAHAGVREDQVDPLGSLTVAGDRGDDAADLFEPGQSQERRRTPCVCSNICEQDVHQK